MKVKYGVLPWEWEHRVCSCSQPGAHIPHPENPSYMSCSVCLKYVRYVMIMCSHCKDRVPKVFEHPNYCTCTPLCWDCCKEREAPCERQRCLGIRAKSKRPPYLEPLAEDFFPREAPVLEDLALPTTPDFDFNF